MSRKILILGIVFIYFFLSLPLITVSASSDCNLCILEFSTGTPGDESFDSVIIGNASGSSISLSSIQLQYFNGNGIYDSRYNLSGTLLAGQVKLFTSEEIKSFNSNSTTLPFNLYSQGGSLKLIKILTSSTTVYDTVGWGNAALSEGNALPLNNNYHFDRKKDSNGYIIDTGDNSQDFNITTTDCSGLNINEIQPFSTDEKGMAITAWVEFIFKNPYSDNCVLATNEGKQYEIPIYNNLNAGDIFFVDELPEKGLMGYIQLPGAFGQVALGYNSVYSTDFYIFTPVESIAYLDLLKNQSIALFEDYGFTSWKATYTSTPGGINELATTPIIQITGDPDACDGVYINELSPNPTGVDTGSEWIELHNSNSDAKNLEQCIVGVESEKYYFPQGSIIGPDKFIKYDTLISEYGDNKTISLRNTEDTYVNLSRIYAGEVNLLQSFIYSDAPEGMTYSKFSEGWDWTYAATPGSINIYQSSKPAPVVTESRAQFNINTLTSPNSTKTSTTSLKKNTTTKTSSSKSLASSAKATTGAKTIGQRDIYEEPKNSEQGNNNYVFVVIGAMAILYAIYEYKIDIQNFILKRRRDKSNFSENRSAAEGR